MFKYPVIKSLYIMIFLISSIAFGQSNVYTNSASGNDTSGDGTSALPYKTFHKAYQSVTDGGVIFVSGTFTWTDVDETGDSESTSTYYSGYKISKNITIQGSNPQLDIIQSATTSNTANNRVFVIDFGFDITLNNLTIRNGKF